MEALEKDFSDLVASEDTVTTDDSVEDIVNQILSADADTDVETTVEEETVEETEEVLEEDTEEDNEMELALADEDGWEDVAEEDLAEMEAFLAELKEDNPDIDFDNVDIVMNEDGEIELYEIGRREAGIQRKKRAKKPSKVGYKLVGGRLVKMDAKELANRKKGVTYGLDVITSLRPLAKPVKSCVSVTSFLANIVASSFILPLASNISV